MKTKCFELNLNDDTAKVIQLIALCVPCFITINAYDDISASETAEYTICARQEDWAWIESKLAPLV